MPFANDMGRHFALWTSASGLPHIARANNKCLCVFWIVVFLVCLAMFIFQMVLLMQTYLAYDVTVMTQLQFQNLDFPAVTICNLNPYKKSTASNQTKVSSLLNTYYQDIHNLPAPDEAIWNLKDGTNDTMAIQANARTNLMYVAASLDKPTIQSLGYDLKDLLISCTFDGKSCVTEDADPNDRNHGDFTETIDPTYGVCWTYNNKNYNVKNSQRAGPAYGLRLLLKTDLAEYLDITESAGMRVTVTSQGEKVFPDAFGYNAAAGFTTSFSLKYISTHRLGYPYGNCSTQPSTQYSTEGCFRECLQDYIVSKCTCGDPRFDLKAGQTYCDQSRIKCVNSAAGVGTTNSPSSGFNAAETCTCPQLCSESTFTMTVSSAVWPAKYFVPEDCRRSANQTGCMKWYRDNTLMMEIYFERMNFEQLNESAAYPFVSLLSDFGGQIGLWIGVSVITVVEFIFVPIMMCVRCCGSKGKKITHVDPDHEELDEEDEDNMFNKVGGMHEPPPPYPGPPGSENGPMPPMDGNNMPMHGNPHPMSQEAPAMPGKMGPDYNDVDGFEPPPIPHSAM